MPLTQAAGLLSLRLKARMSTLSPGQRKVASFIEGNPAAAAMTAMEIARQIGVSDASVIRACFALGFDGLTGLRLAIAEALGEKATQAGTLRQALDSVDADIDGAIALAVDHELKLVTNLSRESVRLKIAQAVVRLHDARRIVLFGTGASAHLAGYGATMLARHGRNTLVLSASGFSLADQMLTLSADDVLLMLCYGQPYAEAEAVVETARALGIQIVMITENRDNPLLTRDDIAIEIRRVGSPGTPLHGASLVCIEALTMGLAAINDKVATGTLEQLAKYRKLIARRRA